ncbi:plasmid replication protein, CyRepA1 family [Acinetobacter guillouiae]|uniref:plasmid replication protein, CyRepA1 family n=1 Tax=Acinetobacter guillouiae TaxID=106649 RepID=UPI003AF7A6F2
MKKAPYHSHDKKPLDKANNSINQWLIENTRIPKLPLSRDSILKNFNLENAQPFLEVGQFVTHEGKELLESGLVLLQYDKALSNLVGLAVQDADRKTVYIGQQGITAFNIEQSTRKDLFLCSTKINTVIKLAETGHQVALSDFETLDSYLSNDLMLLDCDYLFADKALKELTAKEIRYLIENMAKQEREESLRAQHIYALDEIKCSSEKKAVEILEQLYNEIDPFKCSQLAYAYTFKALPNIPYKESLKGVRAKLEGKLNSIMLDLIIGRAQWILDKNKEQALQAITIHDTKQHGHLVINNFDELNDLNYKGVILVKAPTGQGKTQKVGKPFAEWCQNKNYTLVSVAHLRSLISELSSRLNTSHYEDEKETYKQARKAGIETQGFIDSLSVCLPSLLSDAYSKFMSNVRYVFIDEITQVLNVFASEKVFSSTDVEQVFLFFKDLIAKAECLIVADANINQQTIDFIESCRPNERFNIVEIKPKNEHKKALLYESDKELISKIMNDVIGLNKKVWITCDSPKQGRLLYELLNNRNIKTKLILGQDHKIKGSAEFLKDVSNESLKYQVVIASPAISSGVSVEHESPYFNYVAGFFCGTSVRSTDAYQMLGRVRYAKEFHLSISQKSSVIISHKNVIEAKQEVAKLEGGKIEVTDLTKHLERIEESDSKDKNNFANNLYYMLDYYHFEIMRDIYSYDPALDLAGIRKELNETEKQGILNAQAITAEQADKFRRSDYLERSDYYALKAYDKRMYLNMPYDAKLTEQHLDINIAQLKRLNAFCGRYEAATDKSRDISLRNFTEATAKLYKDAFSCIDFKGGAAYDEAVARQILDHIEPYRLKLAAIGAIPKVFGCDRYKRKKSAIKELNAIFTHIGISQKRINNPYNRTERQATIGHMPHNLYRNIGGMCPLSGDKVYLIDEQKLEQQQHLAEIHAAKSKIIELKTVSDQPQDKEPSNESPYFDDMPSNAGFYAIDPDDDYWQTGTS